MKNDGYLLGFAAIAFVISFFVPYFLGTIFLFITSFLIGFIFGRRLGVRSLERKKNPFKGEELPKN